MIHYLKKHLGLLAGSLVVSVVGIDQYLKFLVRSGDLWISNSWIEISLHLNRGVMGGLFSELHPWIVRIFFSVLFGFIVLLTALLIYFLKHKDVFRLKLGILFYVSGILGNVLDRAISGSITDFVNLNLPGLRNFAFNFADLVLFSGLLLIAYSLLRDHHKIWYENNLRKSFIIEGRFQFGFSTFLAFMGGMNAVIVALYSFTFLKVYLDPINPPNNSEIIIKDYFIGLTLIEFLFLFITMGVGILFSHRMAGPIFAFQRYIDHLISNQRDSHQRPFRLRKMDYFKTLESTAEKISAKIKNPH